MAAYQIGDVEKLLSVSASTLRYWETEFPFLQPQKDPFGRRVYSGRDLRVLLRLKHLLYLRRFTIEGAREQLLQELSGTDQNLRGIVNETRAELSSIFFISRRLSEKAAAMLGDPSP
ncbi:MerR family transcriptional regulator [Treponema sp.]